MGKEENSYQNLENKVKVGSFQAGGQTVNKEVEKTFGITLDQKGKLEKKNFVSEGSRRRYTKREREVPRRHFQKVILETKRPTKVTRGGRQFSFTSLVLVKDEEKNSIAYVRTSGKEVVTALQKSSRQAQKKLITYFSPPSRTIPRDIKVKYKSIIIILKPAPPGTGVKAGGALNALFKLLEIKDISAKIIASHRARKNKPNVLRAAFLALDKLTGKKYDY